MGLLPRSYASRMAAETLWWPGLIVDAYRGDGRRYIVESDELLGAFLELEATLL
jgi:hypothetical protein